MQVKKFLITWDNNKQYAIWEGEFASTLALHFSSKNPSITEFSIFTLSDPSEFRLITELKELPKIK